MKEMHQETEQGEQYVPVNTNNILDINGFLNNSIPLNIPLQRIDLHDNNFHGNNLDNNIDTGMDTETHIDTDAGAKTDIRSAIEAAIAKASQLYNLDANLIRSVIKAESNFNPKAVSRAGAMGLMQLMPKTAAGLGVTDAFDIEQNILGGSKYLRNMLDIFNNNLELALAAYNAGPGNVKAYNGIPPFRETRNYINTILNNLKQLNKTGNE
ncbi:MAG TPA: lytic transglycosylase domain-containing protein [Clostridiales bacterium]|nr:lytic transglycosylase domain-containing protein [Clostridiales bacterium]